MSTDVVLFFAPATLGRQDRHSNMLKISRLTDYGLLAAGYLSTQRSRTVSAREIAEYFSLPVPAVSKVLKMLHDGKIIASRRGVGGGYVFEGDPEELTLGRLIEILEGPWNIVECESVDDDGHAVCGIRRGCPSRNFMFGINRAIKTAFDQITLADLTRGRAPSIVATAAKEAVRSGDIQ